MESDAEIAARLARSEERRQRQWMFKKIRLEDDHEEFDIEFWGQQSSSALYDAAVQLHIMLVSTPDEPNPRLQRSVGRAIPVRG